MSDLLDLCMIPCLYKWSFPSMSDPLSVWMIPSIYEWSMNDSLFVFVISKMHEWSPLYKEWSLGSFYEWYFGVISWIHVIPFLEWSLGSMNDHRSLWVIRWIHIWSKHYTESRPYVDPPYTSSPLFMSYPFDPWMIPCLYELSLESMYDPSSEWYLGLTNAHLCMNDTLDAHMISL